jgi:hypothetical protein
LNFDDVDDGGISIIYNLLMRKAVVQKYSVGMLKTMASVF